MTRGLLLYSVCVLLAISSVALAQAPPPAQNLITHVYPTATPIVALTWDPPMGSMGRHYGYLISRSFGDTSHFETLTVVSMPNYLDRDVSIGETYSYRVIVLARTDTTLYQSEPSNTATVTVGPPTPRPHGTISGTITDSISGKPIRWASVLF